MVNHMTLINPQRLLNVDQSDNFDPAFSQSFKNFALKMVTLLLGHIGMHNVQEST